VYSILESDRVPTIGLAMGLGFLCCSLAPWDVDQLLERHHLRDGPPPVPHMVEGRFNRLSAPAQTIVDDALNILRPGGFVAHPRKPGSERHRFALGCARVTAVEPAAEGSPAPLLLSCR
jgi:hypothetical protein